MDDILKEIEKAADDIQIPASLDPNNVKKKLKERKNRHTKKRLAFLCKNYTCIVKKITIP